MDILFGKTITDYELVRLQSNRDHIYGIQAEPGRRSHN